VVINLDRKEIKDTYFIGQEGAYVDVNDMATDGTYLYAATASGIYKALASDPNLQNYNNWTLQTNIPHSDKKFSKIVNFQGKILANYAYTPISKTDDDWAKDELYQLNGEVWTRFIPRIAYVYDVTINGNYLVFSSREEVFVYNEKLELIKYVQKSLFGVNPDDNLATRSAVLDDQNVLWIADLKYGLIKMGTQNERIIPDGPVDNNVFSLTTNGKDLWVAAGGYNFDEWGNLNNPPEFQLRREGKWTVFNNKVFPVPNDFHDIVCVTVDPKNPDHVFAGSWGGGVLEFNEGKFVNRYDNFNSSLQLQDPTIPNSAFIRIGGMDFDSKGNLWVTNTGVAKVLSVFQTDGTWKSFELKNIANQFIGKVVVAHNDDKWVLVPRARGHELYALNSTNDVAKEQRLIAYFSNGKEEQKTPMIDLLSMAVDKNGELWVGTSTGVAVYTNPEKIWEDNFMYASRPGLNLHDGLFHPLLEKEAITAIAIDGANRKWFGTRNSGVYLISDDGETELKHFDNTNSPLPRNDISDIAINQITGEVYIGTSAGLISYMGQATQGNDEFTDVYVYPNPVRETYEGPVVVKGLVDNTDVKITDISGNLVYKTTSLGGQAVWDGKTLNGNRCKTGVYLVFMNNPTGDKTKVTKLLFIH
jgi:hypothetical protein